MTDALPILYSFRRCPYAMRARMAMLVAEQNCELREVVLRAKPQCLFLASPKATVPVLVEPDGTIIDESLEIMRWALARHDPQDWLRRGDHDAQAQMAHWIDRCDHRFKRDLDCYKYPQRHPDADPESHRQHGIAFLSDLDAQLAQHAHLIGQRMSLVDIAVMPFVRQFAGVDAMAFEALPLPHLQRWLNDMLATPLFRAAMVRHPPWTPDQARILLQASSMHADGP